MKNVFQFNVVRLNVQVFEEISIHILPLDNGFIRPLSRMLSLYYL